MTSSRGGSYLGVPELISLAAGFERESAELYERLAPIASPGPVKELLALLGSQERAHERLLREFPPSGTEGSRLQFPPELALSMPDPPQRFDLDAMLAWALERERRSVAIYASGAAAASGAVRELLRGLARFEEEHVARLESLERYY